MIQSNLVLIAVTLLLFPVVTLALNPDVRLTGKTFKNAIDFESLEIRYKRSKNITFVDCTFEASLSGSPDDKGFWRLGGIKVEFIDCKFMDQVLIEGGLVYGQIIFSNCIFAKKVSTTGTEFHSKISFNKSQFQGEGHFENTLFLSSFDFFNCRLSGAIYFQQARFSGEATFSNAIFNDYTSFSQCIFKDVSYFNYTEFIKNLEFNNVVCYATTEWLNSKITKGNFSETTFYSEFINDDMDAKFNSIKKRKDN